MTVKKIPVKFNHLERDWNLINREKKNYFQLSGRFQFHSRQSIYTCNNEVTVGLGSTVYPSHTEIYIYLITFVGESSHPSSVDPLFINESILKNQLKFDVCTEKCAHKTSKWDPIGVIPVIA